MQLLFRLRAGVFLDEQAVVAEAGVLLRQQDKAALGLRAPETEHGRGYIARVHLDFRRAAVRVEVQDVGGRDRHVQWAVFFVVEVGRVADAVDAEAVAAVNLRRHQHVDR